MNTTLEKRQQTQKATRTLIDYIGLALCGFAMGSADVVPGVSGGTMAFILGIYEELVNSIKNLLSPETIKLLLGFKIKEVFDVLPWKFLAAVGIGIASAIVTLAPILERLLENRLVPPKWVILNYPLLASILEWLLKKNQPVLLWSFFFGLVLASIFTVSKRVKSWGALTFGAATVGTVAAYIIVGLVPVETPNTAWFLFLSGAIAICAMILPGISGSFILVLLGKYQYVLSAVNNRDFVTLVLVAAGAAVGIITFAQILGWLFKRYHDLTVAILIGLMLGSLRKIWPWKETVAFILDRHGEPIPTEQINVLPLAWTGEVTFALILAIVGFAIVVLLDYWAAHRQPAEA